MEQSLGDIGGISTLVLILVLSFAIDRFTKSMLFLLSFVKPWTRWAPDPLTIVDPLNRIKADKKQKLILHLLAGALGLIVIALWGKIRILEAVGYKATDAVDVVATAIVLVGGSDIIDKLLRTSGLSGSVAKASASQPIEITGRLVLERSSEQKVEEQAG